MFGFDRTAVDLQTTFVQDAAAQVRAAVSEIEAAYGRRGYDVSPMPTTLNGAYAVIAKLEPQVGPMTQDLQTETARCQKGYGTNWQQSCTIAQNLERRLAAVNASLDAHRELVLRIQRITNAAPTAVSTSITARMAAQQAAAAAAGPAVSTPGGTRVSSTNVVAPATSGSVYDAHVAVAAPALAAAAQGQASSAVESGIKNMLALSQTMAGNKELAVAEFERNRLNAAFTPEQWAQFISWMSGQVRVADEQRARAATLLKDVEFYGEKFATLATRVAQARQLFGLIEAHVNKLTELEQWAIAEFTKRGGTAADVAAATADVRTFPVWGYLVGGAVIIGGALFLSRK